MEKLIESLSPLERRIILFLNLSIQEIQKKTGLDKTSILHALRFLENKRIVSLNFKKRAVIELGTNGIHYKKTNLPERTLLSIIEKNGRLSLEETQKQSGLSNNEFKAALGALKKKALITITRGKLFLEASKEELTKKLPEEKLLEKLPLETDKCSSEDLYALDNLKTRKDIVRIEEVNEPSFTLTELGKNIAGKEIKSDLIEEVTPDLIKTGTKNKFRRYDVVAPVPKITGGKKHFVNQARDYIRKIWMEMGFKEMDGPVLDSSFWVFDALFTAQDHQVRDMLDSFYIKGKIGALPKKELVEKVKESHENGIGGSKGLQYKWKEDEAKRLLLRTHTTSLSVRTLASLKEEEIPAKFFSVGKVFRNETVDWSHGIEFYQTEGIVVDYNVNLRHLFGYLQEFYKKMGFEKIRFRPSFFPYTEPSVEIDGYNSEKGLWLELGGAGMLRPEVTVPLLGKSIPVLAWGQGIDRTIMEFYQIKDLRELYANDIANLRKKKIWVK